MHSSTSTASRSRGTTRATQTNFYGGGNDSATTALVAYTLLLANADKGRSTAPWPTWPAPSTHPATRLDQGHHKGGGEDFTGSVDGKSFPEDFTGSVDGKSFPLSS
jgi:hypothetical protein